MSNQQNDIINEMKREYEDEMNDIIDELKLIMKNKGFTKWAVCNAVGCQPATLSRWLLGKSKPGAAWEKLLVQYIEKIKEDY